MINKVNMKTAIVNKKSKKMNAQIAVANKPNMKAAITKALIFIALLWFIIFLLVVPNISTITAVFWQNGEFTTRAFTRLFTSPIATAALRNSFILAPILSVTVGVLGVSLVLITDYFKIVGSKILRLGYMTTLLYGGIILVSGYRFLYGENGILTNLLASIIPSFNTGWFEGFGAVLFVMTFAATGTHIIFIRNALRSVDYQTIEAARNMGASGFYILRKIVLPVLTPSITAVTIFTFLGGLSAIAAPLLVGGRGFQTINPMILSFSAMPASRDLAALMALILGLSSFVLIAVLTWLEKRGHYLSVSKVKTSLVKQKIKNPILNFFAHIYAYALFLIYVAPVVLIVLFSFTDSAAIARGELNFASFTLNNYIALITNAASYMPLMISSLYSFLASASAIALMILVCRIITKHKGKFSTFLEYAFMIPWVLPSVLIALGLITTFSTPRWFIGGFALVGTMGIMVLGYLIVSIPFTLRMTKAAFYSIDNSLEEAAKNLGAKSFYTFFKIIFPAILPSVMAIFALNFNSLLTEFDMSVFLFHPLAMPLGVQIQNLSTEGSSADSTALTFVYAVLMMVVSAIVLYIAYGRRESKN
ncbi:MAG: iron ABC transporter permease [Defluviitaleaceae bacterium]|nr:iron ABC transporter permease [Defluviitaleaceae bacterium]